jgi:sugar lactone lactonase YvrE
VARYAPTGILVDEFWLPVPQPTCPAFGGLDLRRLFVTSARQGLPGDAMDAAPLSGQTLMADTGLTGQAEYRVIL